MRSTSFKLPQVVSSSAILRSMAALAIVRRYHSGIQPCSTSSYYDVGRRHVLQVYRVVEIGWLIYTRILLTATIMVAARTFSAETTEIDRSISGASALRTF